MTLELVEESEIRKCRSDKNDKKSDLELIDKRDIREGADKNIHKDRSCDKKTGKTKFRLELVGKESMVVCERQMSGMLNNCALCKELSCEVFKRCPNKYR